MLWRKLMPEYMNAVLQMALASSSLCIAWRQMSVVSLVWAEWKLKLRVRSMPLKWGWNYSITTYLITGLGKSQPCNSVCAARLWGPLTWISCNHDYHLSPYLSLSHLYTMTEATSALGWNLRSRCGSRLISRWSVRIYTAKIPHIPHWLMESWTTVWYDMDTFTFLECHNE